MFFDGDGTWHILRTEDAFRPATAQCAGHIGVIHSVRWNAVPIVGKIWFAVYDNPSVSEMAHLMKVQVGEPVDRRRNEFGRAILRGRSIKP
jgi:hypothetical protein